MKKLKYENIRRILGFMNLVLLFMISNSAIAEINAPNLGQVAEHLIVGTDLITKLMHFVCLIMGFGLIIMGVIYFKAHRENPKFMPLDKVVLYIVCGIILASVPFFGEIFGLTGSTIDFQKRETQSTSVKTSQDIDAPLNWGNDHDH